MCYTRRKIQGGVGELRESDDSNFLKPMGNLDNSVSMGRNWLPFVNMVIAHYRIYFYPSPRHCPLLTKVLRPGVSL